MKYRLGLMKANEEGFKEYSGKSINIRDWFVEKENLPKKKEAQVTKITDKAVRLEIDGNRYWIPKVLIRVIPAQENTLDDFI